MGQVFALSWLITWFGHVLKDITTIVRLYDFFLATHPLMPVYFGAAVSFAFSFFLADWSKKVFSKIKKTMFDIIVFLKTENKRQHVKNLINLVMLF